MSLKLISHRVIGKKRKKLDKKLEETVAKDFTVFKSFLLVKFQTKNSHSFDIHSS